MQINKTKLFLLTVIFCGFLGLVKNSHAAYVPPIGIPAPSFGIDEVAPNTATYCPNWPTGANGGANECYYIDNTSQSATDTANAYGYPDKPRLTIPTTYTAGSYVEIHGGPYVSGGTLAINVSGTAQSPIWFRGVDNGAYVPIIQREIVPNGAYTIFENLKFSGSSGVGISFRVRSGSVSHHMAVRQCIWEGTGAATAAGSAVGATGDATHQMSQIVVYDNLIHGFGDFNTIASVEQDWSAGGPGIYSDNFWFLENEVYDLTGDGVIVGNTSADETARPHHVYIGGNTVHDMGENCVDVKRSQNVVISSNVCYGFRYSSHDPGGGFPVHSNPDKVWIINNTVHDSALGVISTAGTNLYILGNIFYNIHHDINAPAWNGSSVYADGVGIQLYGTGETEVANNTIWDTDMGIEADGGGPYNLHNNIIGGRTQATGYDVAFGNSTTATASTIDNNLIYAEGGVRIRWGNATTYDLAGFQAQYSKCTSCISVDPQFANAANLNFTLRNNSPANDAGVALAVYDTFFSLYGIDIKKDLAGTTRPRNATWDIGAYEYFSSSDTTPPASPVNLSVL